MRFLAATASTAALLAALLPTTSLAEQALDREKIKTGILPSGGFYSLYAVTCADESTQYIAKTDRRTRWCVQSGAGLDCYRMVEQASNRACAGLEVAATDTNKNAATN